MHTWYEETLLERIGIGGVPLSKLTFGMGDRLVAKGPAWLINGTPDAECCEFINCCWIRMALVAFVIDTGENILGALIAKRTWCLKGIVSINVEI